MKLRTSDDEGSLDLLLDALCNAFAALIFIAILLALINMESGGPRNEQRDDLLKARIELLEHENFLLSNSINTFNALPQEAKDNQEEGPMDLSIIRQEIAGLKDKKSSIQSEIADKISEMASLVGFDADSILAENIELQLQFTAKNRELSRVESQIDTLQRELDRLAYTMAAFENPARRQSRLPLERGDGGKIGIFVIVTGGKAYPISLFRNGRLIDNTETLAWTSIGDSKRPTPLAEYGFSPSTRATGPWLRYLTDLPKDRYYLSFIVLSDSLAEFQVFKQTASDLSVDLGFELWTGPLPRFGSTGSGPAPRL